ncbi:DDE_3 domain-containing protein [Trichonephila clavipes]|nr:DDE_3 domain-containing protein [Trichonephila clavipes]
MGITTSPPQVSIPENYPFGLFPVSIELEEVKSESGLDKQKKGPCHWLFQEYFKSKTNEHVCNTPAQASDRGCLLQTVKHGGGSVMIWAYVSWFSAGLIIPMKGRITGEKYREMLADHVHLIMHILFPTRDGIFQDDNATTHAVGLVQT